MWTLSLRTRSSGQLVPGTALLRARRRQRRAGAADGCLAWDAAVAPTPAGLSATGLSVRGDRCSDVWVDGTQAKAQRPVGHRSPSVAFTLGAVERVATARSASGALAGPPSWTRKVSFEMRTANAAGFDLRCAIPGTWEPLPPWTRSGSRRAHGPSSAVDQAGNATRPASALALCARSAGSREPLHPHGRAQTCRVGR